MTYDSIEDRERRDRALSGVDRGALLGQQAAEMQRAAAESRAMLGMLNSGGGVADPPPRAEVERILRSNSSLAGAASAGTVDAELAGIRAENARHADACAALARRVADRDGVRLAALVGTGADGTITLTDVLAARDAQPRRPNREARAALTVHLVTRASVFLPSQMVTVNDYGPNPLVEDIAQGNLDKARAVLASGDTPPTLFESGSAPVATGSGIPIEALAAVAWPARHLIARLGQVDAAQLVNRFTPGPSSDAASLATEALMWFADDDENVAYRQRVASWWESWQPVYGGDPTDPTVTWRKYDPTKGWWQQ